MKRRKSTRNLHNSSSRQNDNTVDLVDRISALPDSILGLILSYLPTTIAVATTILSKRWKFVWTTVHNLDFCFEDGMNDLSVDEDMQFDRFVNRVLLLHDGVLLNKFRLVWKHGYIPSPVSTWINTAITRNVHHLFVSVWNSYSGGRHFDLVEIPISLFRCDSLQSLELSGSFSVSAATVVCLPRLESLKLVSVFFWSTEAFEKLICGCPILNYLYIYMDLDDMSEYYVHSNGFKFIISSTSLRRLELGVECVNDFLTPSLHLEASSLEYLKLDGYIAQVFVQGTLSSLVEADFKIQVLQYSFSKDACKFNKVMKAVRAFDCAKALTLSVDVLWALSNATICLPKFRRLTKLEAGVFCYYCSSLQDLIQSSDSLEVLTIYKDVNNLEENDHDDHPKWTAPVEVPRCLSNSLKVVEFIRYAGYDDDREMIGYILKHGSVLEVMKVTSHAWNREEVNFELVKEICKFPRKSSACKVELSIEPPSSWGTFPSP